MRIAEWMERFRLGGAVVARACEGMTAEELDRCPGPGRWTARQVLCHLMDSEMVGRGRLARTLAEENPRLECYDQDLWAARLDYHQRGFELALALFQSVRQANYELLQGVREEDWERRATHSTAGTLTLRDLLIIYTEHAERHAVQIRAARGE